MQRWIGIGLAVMMLVLGGGGFYALRVYKENRPSPMWVPMPLNPELSVEKRDEVAGKIKEALMKPELLLRVSKDLDLPQNLGVKSHEEAVSELTKKVFVNVGEADSPMGIKVPSINVGMMGKVKNQGVSGKIAMRLMDDVWKLLGIEPPPKKEP